MSLANFTYYVSQIEKANNDLLTGVGNARVSVFKIDFETGQRLTAPLYGTKSGGSPLANPFTTDNYGEISFFLDYGEYEIEIEDLNLPIRFTKKVILWRSKPIGEDTIPSENIMETGELPYEAASQSVIDQLVPLGHVLEWWRPDGNTPIPDGYVICNGDSISDHDFSGVGTFPLPDLRNRFVLGATAAKADNAGAGTNTATMDQSSQGPGIGGTKKGAVESSHINNFQHQHVIHSSGSVQSRDDSGTQTTDSPAVTSGENGSHNHGIDNAKMNFINSTPSPTHTHYIWQPITLGVDSWIRLNKNDKVVSSQVTALMYTDPDDSGNTKVENYLAARHSGISVSQHSTVNRDYDDLYVAKALSSRRQINLYDSQTSDAGWHPHFSEDHNHGGNTIGAPAGKVGPSHRHGIPGHRHGLIPHSHTVGNHNHGGLLSLSGASSKDTRPQFVGLLMIMKVKRNG